MEETKTQWHPAFCSAVKLEFIADKNGLEYNEEKGLASKPVMIDLLVIKKSSDLVVANKIGEIFKGHNIFEYKSPKDGMNIDTFYKTIAYASLYKISGTNVNSIHAEDITISLVREGKPRKLIKQLNEAGMLVTRKYPGIYTVQTNMFAQIQIIVYSELGKEEHLWLTALTENLDKEHAKRLLIETEKLKEKDDKEFADSLLQVAMKANKKVFSKMKEVPDMCKALQELMQPELDEMKIKGREEGKEAGQNALLEAIFALKNGQTSEELLASGYDANTIERAKKVI